MKCGAHFTSEAGFLVYLNIVTLLSQGDGSTKTYQTCTYDQNLEWHFDSDCVFRRDRRFFKDVLGEKRKYSTVADYIGYVYILFM